MRNCCPPPRKAVALRMSSQLVGKRRQSKFCSSSVILPIKPALEFTPTPNIKRPVCVSCPSTLMGISRGGSSSNGPAPWGYKSLGPAYPPGLATAPAGAFIQQRRHVRGGGMCTAGHGRRWRQHRLAIRRGRARRANSLHAGGCTICRAGCE